MRKKKNHEMMKDYTCWNTLDLIAMLASVLKFKCREMTLMRNKTIQIYSKWLLTIQGINRSMIIESWSASETKHSHIIQMTTHH